MSDYRQMAKCTCGSILIWSYIDGVGNAWVHWRPVEDCFEEGAVHEIVEDSIFRIDEDEFDDWNDKTEQELRDSLTTMSDFWKKMK